MTTQSRGRSSGLRLALLAVGAAAAVAACSSSTTSSSSPSASPATTSPTASPTTGSPSSATCQHVRSLRASLTSLTHLTLSANASSQIRNDVTNIETQLAALRGEASGAFATQLNQLNAAVSQVTTAAAKMGSPPTAAQTQAVITALSNLKARSASAIAAMNAACP